jgi:hypothetical protein
VAVKDCRAFGQQSCQIELDGVAWQNLSGLVRGAHAALLPGAAAQAKVKFLASKQHRIHRICRQNCMWKQRQPLLGSAASFNAEGGDGGSNCCNCRSVAAIVGNCVSASHCESVGNCESVSHCKSVSSAEVTWNSNANAEVCNVPMRIASSPAPQARKLSQAPRRSDPLHTLPSPARSVAHDS